MRIRTPSYWNAFHCRMGACLDTCCRDWEIVLDRETRSFYETVPGELGEELRAQMARGGDCFALDGALCPFLNGEGLCRIQLALGQEHLTHNCASYPRFGEEYGALREWALAISCPEAARLILTAPEPAAFALEKTTEPLMETNDLDPELFQLLMEARTSMYVLACDRSMPFADRLALTVRLAERVQERLDHGKYAGARKRLARFAPGRERDRLRVCVAPDAAAAGEILEKLRSLDILTPRFAELLAAAEPETACSMEDAAWENLLIYFLYRYVLKAVLDGDLLGRVRAAVIGCVAIRALLGPYGFSLDAMIDIAHRYGREIEHDADNFAALVRWPLPAERLIAAVFL